MLYKALLAKYLYVLLKDIGKTFKMQIMIVTNEVSDCNSLILNKLDNDSD